MLLLRADPEPGEHRGLPAVCTAMVSTAVVSTALVSTALPQVTLPPVPSGLGLGDGLAHGTSESKDEAVQTCSKSPVGTTGRFQEGSSDCCSNKRPQIIILPLIKRKRIPSC